MKSFSSDKIGRIVVMHLGKGEKLLESIRSEIKRLGIKNGILLSAIGSLRKVSLHIIKTTEDLATNEYITLESPFELSAVQGMILNGEPHFHMVFSDPEKTYTGHMEDGSEVQYLAELSFLEVEELALERKTDALGISYIDWI